MPTSRGSTRPWRGDGRTTSCTALCSAACHPGAFGSSSGWFRASGNPVVAHLVGTAGILAAVRARTPVVAAGLSHSVYALGDLPAGSPGMSGTAREEVRGALGVEAEDLAARYEALE